MAHAIVEWTDNLVGDLNIRGLLELIAREMREANGVFPWGGIRVRGIKLVDYVIADDTGQDAFVNVTVKLGAGRSTTFKEQFFSKLFKVIVQYLEPITNKRFLAVSLYVEETDEAASFKANNIHARFGPKA